MATAARLSADVVPLCGSRANAAQRAAIFRLVASSNDLMLLDYTSSAIDEMTATVIPGRCISIEPGISRFRVCASRIPE